MVRQGTDAPAAVPTRRPVVTARARPRISVAAQRPVRIRRGLAKQGVTFVSHERCDRHDQPIMRAKAWASGERIIIEEKISGTGVDPGSSTARTST